MKFFFPFIAFFQLFFPVLGNSAFPQWITPDRAKILAVENFFLYMGERSSNYYRLNEIKYLKEVLENGSEIIYVQIFFSTPSCKGEAKVEFWDYLCNERSCGNHIVVEECISKP